ncbi:MAG: putative membrane protein [Paracoccaceae bacterium]
MESWHRSFTKAVVWNVIGLTVMLGVGFAFTGSIALGGAMAVINTAIGLCSYVLYERVWSLINWGRHV